MVNICGTIEMNRHPLPPYSEIVCDFLDAFASALFKNREAGRYPDVMTFAFWARKGNIQRKRTEFISSMNNEKRLGKGIVFHIAPSNVPVNCMFTYAFGLLAGNGNIVRVPVKKFPQVEIMLNILKGVLEEDAFSVIKEMTSFVRYDRQDVRYTRDYSSMCDVRVIWGGDDTIHNIREIILPPRSTEITFADRYSFGVVELESINDMSEKEMKRLSEGFYNDTYLMDQNACSTPHLICFRRGNLTADKIDEAKNRFWTGIAGQAVRYEIDDIKVSDKYTDLCRHIMNGDSYSDVKCYSNALYVCVLASLPDDVVESCRGRYGLFYEYEFDNMNELGFISDEKVQTCATCGVDENEIREYIIGNGITGIDRVVKFGHTLDIDTVWDGYDLITCMSRVVG